MLKNKIIRMNQLCQFLLIFTDKKYVAKVKKTKGLQKYNFYNPL